MPPLFMISFLDIHHERPKEEKIIENKEVGCFGLSFPGDSGSARRPQKLVEYRVNTVWWENNYGNEQPDEDDE